MTESRLWRALRAAFSFDAHALAPVRGLRAAVGVALVLGVGVGTGHTAPGVFATVGALISGTVAFTAGARTPYATMLGAGLALAVSTAVGGLTAHSLPVELAALVVWGALAGLVAAAGQAAATVGVQAVVGLVVLGRFPLSAGAAAAAAGEVMLGAAVQTLLAVLIRPPSRDRAERFELAAIADALSAWAGSGGRAQSGRIADRVTAARALLERKAGTGSGTPLRSLLTGLARSRYEVSVLTLQRERHGAGARRHGSGAEAATGIDATLAAAVEDFHSLAVELRSGHPTERAGDDALAPLLTDADDLVAHRARALAGQLRAAHLAFTAWAEQRLHVVDRWHERSRRHPTFTGVRAALLRPSPLSRRHAIRLAVLLPVAEGLARVLPVQRGYWIALTAVVVLKPDFATSTQRGIGRVLGTLIGVVPVSLAVGVTHPRGAILVALVGVLAWAGYSSFPASFAVYSACLAGLVVVLLDVVSPGGASVAGARAVDTLIGGVLALLAYLVFPSWEAPQLGESVAGLIEAEDGYASAVLSGAALSGAVLSGAAPASGAVDAGAAERRQELGSRAGDVRAATAALEAAVGRAELEPSRLTGTAGAAGLRIARDALAANRRIVASLHVLHTIAVESSDALAAAGPELGPALHAVLADTARGVRERAAFHDEVDLRAVAGPAVSVVPGSSAATVAVARELDEIVDAVDTLRFALAERTPGQRA